MSVVDIDHTHHLEDNGMVYLYPTLEVSRSIDESISILSQLLGYESRTLDPANIADMEQLSSRLDRAAQTVRVWVSEHKRRLND